MSTSGIADERRFWVNAAGVQKPDHTADYFGGALPLGWMDKGQVGTVDPSLTVDARVPTQWEHRVGLIASAQRRQVAVVFDGLGIAGSRAPLTSIALDDIGLSYPLAGHAEMAHRGRPGHETNLPLVWVVADLAAPNWPGYPGVVDPSALAAARHALTCGPLAHMQHAVRDPMTPDRFLDNLVNALDNTRLVVPSDPFAAERRFCGSPG